MAVALKTQQAHGHQDTKAQVTHKNSVMAFLIFLNDKINVWVSLNCFIVTAQSHEYSVV